MIDAAEFVGPYQDRRLGLQKAAKYYYTTGWHETATVSELLINKAAWDKLPRDLQAIVSNAAAACNVISEGWCQKANSEAMEDLIKNQTVIARPLPDPVIKALRAETDKVLAEAVRCWPSPSVGTRRSNSSPAISAARAWRSSTSPCCASSSSALSTCFQWRAWPDGCSYSPWWPPTS